MGLSNLKGSFKGIYKGFYKGTIGILGGSWGDLGSKGSL